jgi:membrane protein YdbS with pleckstrin-like domain
MSLLTAVGVFVVGFVSGAVTRWFAGLAAVLALILVLLGGVAPESLQSLVEYVVQRYYVGNELLFIAGFLFGIDANETKEAAVERRSSNG